MPSYMNPATSCVDCQISAGKEELQNIHRHHKLFTWDYLLRAWFLLMNGMFLPISQELVLGSIIKLLGCVVIKEGTPYPFRFSEELFVLKEHDGRPNLEFHTDGYSSVKRGIIDTRLNKMSQCMRFPTMWYVRPAKPQISLRIRAV